MTRLVRTDAGWAVEAADGHRFGLGATLADLLAVPLAEARERYDAAAEAAQAAPVRAPVDAQEVWAAGVTYQRSREGRREESEQAGHAGLYDHVYTAPRPEIFFKATAGRVVGDGEPVGIRADSGWDVPEAELGLVVNAAGEVFGYTVGNDVSSRSIEGENPLYLPQAKVYTRSCALGPAIVPVWEAGPGPFPVAVRVEREGAVAWSAETSTARLARTPADLVSWLTRALDFPAGVVLLTGTGAVPDRDFTLQAGDVVTIDVAGVGTLRNPVMVVGTGG
ncbi:fumarylacetoacetate hydrolase family protein [Phytohabitans sp. ZYX-F-186]|uniref:Fumarylacetoacetate hydrolase family protein n=1 Tax=Phytohabitans maris TaxID=3071409 RepID=A0ABU0ZGY4_9ACTN|nr:fumarylacetoacetate hydrolase family protein [Phytohabitans sp. ZYX-F-186]MDQ7906319.1 fumarylacetoacetate hydrolase family protein [Phytohabitans sp. ZYX-F-186]